MAPIPPPSPLGWPQGHQLLDDKYNFDAKEYAIGGKMVKASVTAAPASMLNMTDDEWRRYIKTQLATQLALFIVDNGLCEFTTWNDTQHELKAFGIRCYLAPNDQIKILRTRER
jgi:hypothetical protein